MIIITDCLPVAVRGFVSRIRMALNLEGLRDGNGSSGIYSSSFTQFCVHALQLFAVV